MKKILYLLFLCFLLTGCGKVSSSTIVNNLNKKIEKGNGYHIVGELSIKNNDEVYDYNVDVFHMMDNYYKVILTNLANNHTQIILKNDDGVYVVTPSLNKSFRFQSDWPYNNSQIYLLDAIIKDINNDSKLEFLIKDKKYIIKTKVNYPNNSKLVEQKIVFSDNFKPKKIAVYDNDGVECMNMSFKKVDFSPKLKKDDFKLDNIIDKKTNDIVEETSNLEDVIYPLFLPAGTKLINEEKVAKDKGERVIMNYDGEKSFVLVEETADVFDEFTIIPSYGEPYFLMDTLGVMTDNSLSWVSGGVEFYLVSDVMSSDEMLEVAQSITGIVSMK